MSLTETTPRPLAAGAPAEPRSRIARRTRRVDDGELHYLVTVRPSGAAPDDGPASQAAFLPASRFTEQFPDVVPAASGREGTAADPHSRQIRRPRTIRRLQAKKLLG